MIDYRLRELKIEVNRDCPLQCLHCSSNGMPKAPERLDPHKVSELIREFAYLGGEKICISGGEPLCYSELSSVINSCHETNIDISLYTTGIVRNGGPSKPISEKMAAFLANKDVKIIFSLHGANDSTHDRMTQVQGSFNSTLMAIERTLVARALVEVHVVPTTINLPELVDIAKLAESFDIKKISWLRFVPQGRGFLNKSILELGKNQIQKLTEIKEEITQACPSLVVRTGAPFNVLCPETPAECDAGKSILTINPDGSVSPCDAFKRFVIPDKFGNVLQHSLSEIWHDSYILNLVRALHQFESSSSCTSCSLYSNCKSGCFAQKAIVAGTLTDGRDPLCPSSIVLIAAKGQFYYLASARTVNSRKRGYMYRSKTMRSMPQNTRKLAHLLNEAESAITRLQNQIPIIESLEREVIAWNRRQEHYKNTGKIDPIKFEVSIP